MQALHIANISLHVVSGCAAILLGLIVLAREKGTRSHASAGRKFVYASLLVCGFAAIGLASFRFMPMFAVLTIIVAYQVMSGWRLIATKAAGPQAVDALLVGMALAWLVVTWLVASDGPERSHIGFVSAVATAATLLLWDTARWFFPRRWYAVLWRYEHAYKMVGALFGMLSALAGNVIRWGHPWSQLLPTAMGFLVTGYFFVKLARAGHAESSPKA